MATTYEKIASVTVGSGGAASIIFSTIASDWDDLSLLISARSTYSAVAVGCFLQMNSVTSGYSTRNLYGTGASALSSTNPYGVTSKYFIGSAVGASATGSTFSSISTVIPNYDGSTSKSLSSDSVTENNATTAYQELLAGLCTSTAAISTITLTLSDGNFVEHSTAVLYGIKKS